MTTCTSSSFIQPASQPASPRSSRCFDCEYMVRHLIYLRLRASHTVIRMLYVNVITSNYVVYVRRKRLKQFTAKYAMRKKKKERKMSNKTTVAVKRNDGLYTAVECRVSTAFSRIVHQGYMSRYKKRINARERSDMSKCGVAMCQLSMSLVSFRFG